MKKYIIISFICLFNPLTHAAKDMSHDGLRKCYEDTMEKKSDDDLLTLVDIAEPEKFFNNCGKLDKSIIKEMYSEFYNMLKMTYPQNSESNIEEFKTIIIEGAQALRIDFYPEDFNHLEQWKPFSEAISAVNAEQNKRKLGDGEPSDKYLDKLNAIEATIAKLNDADLAHYTFEYISRMTADSCSKDCEKAFELFGKYFINKPNAKKILKEQTNEHPFLVDKINLVFPKVENKYNQELKNKIKSEQPKTKSESYSNPQLTSDSKFSDPLLVCKIIKQISNSNNCSSSKIIISNFFYLDNEADTIIKTPNDCGDMITIKTINTITPAKIKKQKKEKVVDLVVQIFNQNSGYIFNENWQLKNLQYLKNNCK